MHVIQPKLLIRADATPQAGLGHAMRMLALAQAWMDRGGRVELLGHVEAPGLAERLRGEGVLVRTLGCVHPHPGDLAALCQTLDEDRPDWVALDGYHFGPDYQAAVRNLGTKVLVVDDMAHHPAYAADLILNQNLEAEGLAYTAPGAHMLLGPRFALLRREFRLADQTERQSGPARRILVSAGGSDPAGLTPLLLEALAICGIADLEARVVCGPANARRSQLEKQLRELPFPAVLITPGVDMPSHMAWADLALTAAGSTCWELARMGVPMLAYVLVDNQRGVLRGLVQAGMAADGGVVGEISPAEMAGQILELAGHGPALASLSAAGRKMVDGQGAMRVAEAMLPTSIRLRPAGPDDCLRLFHLANDPLVRAASFDTRPIILEEHRKWLDAKLSDPECLLLMAENQFGLPLGQVRLDRKNDLAVISVSMMRDSRGLGLAGSLLRQAARHSWDHFGLPVLALVRLENEISRRAFAKAGFREAGMTEQGGVPARRMVFHGGL